jgi:hypothetical protein
LTKIRKKNTKKVCFFRQSARCGIRQPVKVGGDVTSVEIDLEGIVVIVGNFGSGKTEIAVNLAIDRKRAGIDVRLVDLDLVNPYFRTREARNALRPLGIDLVLPPEAYLHADLPILSPMVAGAIRNPGRLTLIDVGGDPVGARVLSSLADAFRGRHYRMLQVVNPLRPETAAIEGCLEIRRAIETASRLQVTGWIGNANLIDETVPDDIVRGYEFAEKLARASRLPLAFITVPAWLSKRLAAHPFACPVLHIKRQLVPPWKKAQAV